MCLPSARASANPPPGLLTAKQRDRALDQIPGMATNHLVEAAGLSLNFFVINSEN
jgi:hypothetical protein